MPAKREARPMASRIDGETYARLQAAADQGGRSVTEEVRQRLAASFEAEEVDPATRQLTTAIAALAGEIGKLCGAWHADPAGFAAFKTALDLLVAHYRPQGEPTSHPKIGASAAALFFDDNISPENVGRVLAMTTISKLPAVERKG